MRRGVIDGVTVVWRDSPGPLSAELSFGCGHRDEELDTIGLSHFVQLLACLTPEHAGLASHLTTSFTAAGTAGRIVRELADICSVLAGPPDPDRMAEVAAEADPGERFSGLSFDNDLVYPFASLLSRRFGACGPGLIRWPAPDYSVFTAEQVKAHIERFFTASNAVLTLTGQPPSGLRLPLPQGPKPERAALAFKSTPFWYQDEVDGAGISFHAGNGPLPFLVVSLVRTRLGKSVRAVPDSVLLDATWQEAGITLTPWGRKAAAGAAQEVWAQLRRLASSGPAPGELEEALAALNKARADAESQLRSAMARLGMPVADLPQGGNGSGSFEMLVERELCGASESFDDAQWVRLAQVEPDQVRHAVAGWLRSAIIVVPRGTRPVLDGVAESPCPTGGGHVPAGEVFKPSLLKRWRGGDRRIVLDPAGVSVVDTSGAHLTGLRDLVSVTDGEGCWWVGDPGHGCLHDISAFGRAGDRIRQAAPPLRRRLLP